MADGAGMPRMPKPSDADVVRIERLKRRYDTLKTATERANCESHWQEIGEVVSPRKIDFVGMRTPGEKRQNKVYDPTGILANEMLAAGLHGMATNPSTKWFSLRMIAPKVQQADGQWSDLNEDKAVMTYLSHVEDVMWSKIYQPGTNFTTALHEVYLDLGSFGTAILFCGQRDDGGLLFECRPLAECVIAENADGKVDTVMRCTEYTVRQLVQMQKSQGWTISDKVMDLYRSDKWDEKVKVIHVVYPRFEREPGKKDPGNMPWASIYFEHEACHLLKENGFPEFPYLVPRWSKYAGEVYGRSPGMTALPDVKMLQAMTLTKIKLMQKAADPPMWLRDDGVVGQTRTIPGGVNYWRGNPNDGIMLQPVSLQGIQAIAEDISGLREQILKAFYADIMRMTDRADMTATEVVQRTAEQMRLFGPLIGRLESEMLGPLVERVFGILSRMGALPAAPDAIAEQEFTVEYVSPIATAQKQISANGIMQAMGLIAGVVGPEGAMQIVPKEINVRKIVSWAWDLFNCDPDLLADQQQQETGDQMQQANMALGMAGPAMDVMAKGGKAIKDVATAHAQEGTDVQAMIAGIQDAASKNPKAQEVMRGMMGQQASEVMDAQG